MHKLLIGFFLFISLRGIAQCPPNIGFETGTFNGWQCSFGEVTAVGTNQVYTLTPGSPTPDIHVMVQNSGQPQLDYFGQFPITSPNGSTYSIKLGSIKYGRKAQRASYTFTVPANDQNYSIIYDYAIVFENPTGHLEYEQPRFTAKVYDVASDTYINCASYSYTAFGDNLRDQGFSQSIFQKDVYYKTWTPVTIKLSGYAGKTLRLEFTTNDCTRSGHFGYAYIDVNEHCSTPITGTTQCLNSTAQQLIAPYGYAKYRWYPADFSGIIGITAALSLNPPPAAGTRYAVEITPFPNQGCLDTLYADITTSSEPVILNTTGKIVSCITHPVDLTDPSIVTGSSPGLVFDFFSDAALTSYIPSPKAVHDNGTYYIKATNSAGCSASAPLTVQIKDFPVFTISDPPEVQLPNTADLTTAAHGDLTGVTLSFWKDTLATIPLTDPSHVTASGKYFIKATIQGGCTEIFGANAIVNKALIRPPNVFSPNGDGTNDTWEIPYLMLSYPACTVDVFNRSGQLVFHSIGYNIPWNGRYKDKNLPVGTYYYVIKPAQDVQPVGGSITIIR